MRKHAKNARNSAKKFRRSSLKTIIVAAAILALGAVAIGAVSIVSRQKSEVKASGSTESKTPVANKADKNFVTMKVAGQEVQVDGETGQIKELTPEEARKLAAGLKQHLNQSTQDLKQIRRADGSMSVDLEGRFQNVTVAKVAEDGTVVIGCFDSPKGAAAFFGINPDLIEDASPRQGNRITPAKTHN